MMNADAKPPSGDAFSDGDFDAFYDSALPVVYGYLLRLCGGDHDEAWDLTQDSWMALVDRLADGQRHTATIGWLLAVARSRYLDHWRRRQRLQRKLRLVWAAERERTPCEVSVTRDDRLQLRLATAIARAITATGVIPDAVTADRGYGQTSVDTDLADLGVELVAILRTGQPGKARQQTEAADSFVELIKWRTGAEGRI